MDTKELWRIALHEGGHAVVAESLGAKAKDAVMLLEGDHMRQFHDPFNRFAANGCATYGVATGEFPTAIIAAAGHAAESLAATYPPPPIPEPDDDEVEAQTKQEAPRTDEHKEAVDSLRVGQFRELHDDQVVALYAINKDLKNTETWAPSAMRVRGEAASIVKQHADTVVKVATVLFRQGYIMPEEMRVLLDGIAPQPTVENCA